MRPSFDSMNTSLWCLPFDHIFAEVSTVFSFERSSAPKINSAPKIKQCIYCGWVQP